VSTRKRITVTLDGRVAVFKGWQVAELIKEAGAKPIYAGTVGGWMIDRHRLADVLAYLDERNIAVTAIDDTKSPIGDLVPDLPPIGGRSGASPDGGVPQAEDGGLW